MLCCSKRFEAHNEVLSINVGLTDRPVSNVPRSHQSSLQALLSFYYQDQWYFYECVECNCINILQKDQRLADFWNDLPLIAIYLSPSSSLLDFFFLARQFSTVKRFSHFYLEVPVD